MRGDTRTEGALHWALRSHWSSDRRRITHRKTVRTHVKCHLRQPDSSHRSLIQRSIDPRYIWQRSSSPLISLACPLNWTCLGSRLRRQSRSILLSLGYLTTALWIFIDGCCDSYLDSHPILPGREISDLYLWKHLLRRNGQFTFIRFPQKHLWAWSSLHQTHSGTEHVIKCQSTSKLIGYCPLTPFQA